MKNILNLQLIIAVIIESSGINLNFDPCKTVAMDLNYQVLHCNSLLGLHTPLNPLHSGGRLAIP